MEYLCHNENGYVPLVVNTRVLSSFMNYHRGFNYINTTSASSGAGTTYSSGTHEFTPACRIQYWILWVELLDSVENVKETITADSVVTVLDMVAYQEGKAENVIRVS
jgi:kynureninase